MNRNKFKFKIACKYTDDINIIIKPKIKNYKTNDK